MSPLRQVVLVGLLAALALLLLLFAGPGPDDADLGDYERREGAADPQAAMRVDGSTGADAPDAADAPPAPLEGTGTGAGGEPQVVTFRVVDRSGEPIPWLPLQVKRYRDGRKQGGTYTSTEADGRKVVADVVLGTDTVQLFSEARSIHQAILTPALRITDVDQTIRIERVRRVRRRFVDAETGQPLEVPRVQCFDDLRGKNTQGGPVTEHVTYDMEDHAGRSAFRTHLTPPDGYVYWDSELWSQPISAYADELDLVVPLRRMVDVRLTVLAHDGTPSESAEVLAFTVAFTSRPRPEALRDGFGTLHVKGVPYFRGELLSVRVGISDTTAVKTFRTVMPDDPDTPIIGTITLPKPEPTVGPGPATTTSIGLGGGGSGAGFRGRLVGDRGRAEIRVVRHDGSPAVGARVRIGTAQALTDVNGVARLSGVLAGEQSVRVEQRGLLPITGTITVSKARTAKLKLQEQPGATIVLEVVDDLGQPLPYARFVTSIPNERAQYIDEQRGVQRIDRFVDHRGKRTLRGVDPRVEQVRIYWASRSKIVPVTLSDGKRVPLRVVLPSTAGGR